MAKLSDLKNLLANAPKRDAATPKPSVVGAQPKTSVPRGIARAKPTVATPDTDLAQAFAGVTPLPPANRATHRRPRPSTAPVQHLADEADALAASKFGSEPSTATWDVGQEQEAHQTFLRNGLGNDVLVKLRRGHWVVQGDIDLHGMTRGEAHDALADFLDAARAQGWRCVRVVHGKGLSSPNREPVLKGKVRRWLAQWDDVLGYCEAQPHAGGSGAVLVLLKARVA
jgi:DNA-nicking Smr family endonuclease